jgi:putative peptidoglycan lipid II flippase
MSIRSSLLNRTLWRSVAVSAVYGAGLCCSFGNQIAIAYYLGSGVDGDLYFAAQSIPMVVAGLVGVTLSFGLPALLVDYAADKPVSHADRVVASSVLALLVLLGLTIAALVAVHPAISAYSSWFQVARDHQRTAAFDHLLLLTWLSAWLSIVCGYVSFLASIRQHQILGGLTYAVPALAGILALVWFHSELGAAAAVIGQIVGLLFCGLLLSAAAREILWSRPDLREVRRVAMAFLRRVPWFAAATLCFTGYPMVDSYLTAHLAEGQYSALAYGQRLTIAGANLVISGPSLFVVKRICGEISSMPADGARSHIVRSVRMILLVLIPISIVCSEFSKEIVQVLFGYGHFGSGGVDRVGAIFGVMALSIPFMGGGVILSRGLVAGGSEHEASFLSLAWLLAYALLSWYLSPLLQSVGIAWSFMMSWTCITLGSCCFLVRKDWRTHAKGWITMAACGAATFVAARLSHRLLEVAALQPLLALLAGATAAMLVYVVLGRAIGVLDEPLTSPP